MFDGSKGIKDFGLLSTTFCSFTMTEQDSRYKMVAESRALLGARFFG